jgi:phosphoglycolate phosphatase-like HAD superfamily hydrolase
MRLAGPVGFDLDLTLINSRPAIMAAWTAVTEELQVSIDLDEVDRRMGIKLEDEVAYWFPEPDQSDATASYRRHYVRLAPELTLPLPGAAEALASVRDAGERAVVVTAKHPVSVEPSLAAAGLQPDEVFAHVHGPEKAVVLARLGAAVYVGDTPADMVAGLAGGATAVGVPTGSFGAGDLAEAGASVVLGSLAEFPAWYAGFRACHSSLAGRAGCCHEDPMP